ncbi:MAG: hypothetical protein LBK50_00480 [Candidatus Nomurabacteria bacterium]|jgi:hypothetical protein|nr:hypothetical protein [Candidatus Nomurabacteria bacterium]
MKQILKNLKSESGAVSMLTVIFFVLFLSVLSVSFLRIVNEERQRSLANELSASALAAAEAGVEDAKRVLLYCMNQDNAGTEGNTGTGSPKDNCAALNNGSKSNDCTAVINKFRGTGIINVDDSNSNGLEGVVDSNGDYQQYYPCMFIDRFTDTIEFNGTAVDTKSPDVSASIIAPLDLAVKESENENSDYVKVDFDVTGTITLDWHLVASNGGVAETRGYDANPVKSSWNNAAMLRVEMVKVGSNFSINNLAESSYAVTLRPSGEGGAGEVTLSQYAPNTSGVPNNSNTPIKDVNCASSGVYSGYQCRVNIKYDGSNMNFSNGVQYYMKITPLYRDATVSIGVTDLVAIKDSKRYEDVKFNGIQPLIDVTGRVNNTYRRVIARVAPNAAMAGEMFFPEYTIESATKVCKKMRITNEFSSDACDYTN